MGRPRRTSGAFEGLPNDDRLRLLSIIDQFRELGLNEEISLPQLVVVGDQSSGKSSLLEGITGLSFPVASDLCTRFATQIVLRRSEKGEGNIDVSIIAGPTSNQDLDAKAKLDGFSRKVEGDELSKDDFAMILDEAAICMGLPASTDQNLENLTKRFSDDILRIELSGPEHHHLSVVDVPGLFHNPTKYQTKEDLGTIRGLIESYITDKRTIILAVMDARNNLANQEVFRMARAADPQGGRTVGIITKCDALQAGDEEMVLKIAKNEVERLTHGWFAVRNRSTQDIQDNVTLAQRHKNEKAFFTTTPWVQLPKKRVGIPALKQFLGELLYAHVRGEFPALVEEIRSLAKQCEDQLAQLGSARQTAIQQRQFLTRLAGQHQQDVFDCLRGNYGATWVDGDPRKLRMLLHLENDKFANKMRLHGHTRPFRKVDDSIDYDVRQSENLDRMPQANSAAESANKIYTWIRARYRESRGAELPGTLNASVLENLFRQQSIRWQEYAEKHITAINNIVTTFNTVSWSSLIIDETLRKKIMRRNVVHTQQAETRAKEQLDLLLADEMTGILQTTNHYFAENLSAIRRQRVTHRLQQQLGLTGEQMRQVTLNQVMTATHLSNEDQAVYDIHDTLKAYYKVALKRFVDNVVLQVVERCYLSEHGPIKFISPQYVGDLTDEELADIAQEGYASSSTRAELAYRLERLQRAMTIAEEEHL